ncbi:Isopropylmalate dehydrogenase-like domain-containing protein [Aspergillus ambiguus]|uniref:Isopropylmalate dehydrogenase-like domain-containing protein n=1 Tax=Aspergillus ambiguus TaxID=176160 RepID=UPI003CCDD59C
MTKSKADFSILVILVIAGDGIGPEVTAEATAILDLLSEHPESRATFKLIPRLFGGCSIDRHGVPVTDEVLETGRQADAILMGAVGGPKWDGLRRGFEGPEGATLRLREVTQVYANQRPCEYFPAGNSPLREELVRGAKFIVLRENCGGAFYGHKEETKEYASDLWSYQLAEIERVSRMAAHLARSSASPRKTVISCDKANVLASSRLWRQVVQKTIDWSFLTATTLVMMRPTFFNGVVLADNTFGVLLSDLAGVIPGTLGMRQSRAFMNQDTGLPLTLRGRGIANPIGAILSAALMLRYSFGMEEEATAIERAVHLTLDTGLLTRDMKGAASTKEMGHAIRRRLQELLARQ